MAVTQVPHRRAHVISGRPPRISAWATSSLRDLVYAGAVFLWSIVTFTVLVVTVSVTLSLLIFVIGVFVWVGFVYLVRGTTWVDRRLAGWQRREYVEARYRKPADPGFLPLLKTVSSDPQTWQDLAWLAVTSVAGFALGLVAITAAAVDLAYVSLPAWYWAIPDPSTQYGLTNVGMFTVDTLGEAFVVMAVGLLFVPLVLLLARGCARAHSALAVRLLRGRPHPEADAAGSQLRTPSTT